MYTDAHTETETHMKLSSTHNKEQRNNNMSSSFRPKENCNT